MKLGIVLVGSLIAACSLAFSAQSAPPAGKDHGNSVAHPGKWSGKSSKGNPGKRGSGKYGRHDNGSHAGRGKKYLPHDASRRNPSHVRSYKHSNKRKNHRNHLRSDPRLNHLVLAGITAALAREYALDLGLRNYSSLPPGIRKNLTRGKPLPPGIAKKMVAGPLISRLPKHPGYEWRIAGTDLILISVATAVIADILYDVFN